MTLKQRRKAAGLSQRELGRRAKCRQATISNIERGVYGVSAELTARLESALEGRPEPERLERTAGMRELHEIWCRDWAGTGTPEPYSVQVIRRQR